MKIVALTAARSSKAFDRQLLSALHRKHSSLQIVTIAAQAPLFDEAGKQAVVQADALVIATAEHEPAQTEDMLNAIQALTKDHPRLAEKPVVIFSTSYATQGQHASLNTIARAMDAHGVKADVIAKVSLDDVQHQFANGSLSESTQKSVHKAMAQLKSIISKQEDDSMSQPKIAWDATYDVIVLGFGGAGATAARFAADSGAKVLLVDAAPLGHEGGNTRYAGQIVGSAADFDEMKNYYKRLQYPLALDEDMIDTYVDGMVGMSDYFQKYLEIEKPFSVRRDWHHEKPDLKSMLPEYPEYAGGDSYDVLLVHDGTFDSAFWKTLREQVTKRADKIDVWFKAPAKHLIQDPTTKAVIGAQIERESVLLNIRANNGVVLATGGFENNQQMIQDYLGAESLQPLGSVYNKGDGVLLGQEVGADLWHMHNYESLGLTIRKPAGTRSKILFAWTTMAAGSAFVIGDDGTRYMNETEANRHGHLYDHGTWRIPANNAHPYLIFDAAKYQEFAEQAPDWLDGLAHADTLVDLADILHVPAENLAKTRARFDQFANNGEDQAFDRDASTMTALGDGPYYALALRQSMLNTQGGPRRNVRTEVLDTTGNPILHLYSAGELGGISANQYQGGNNLAECLIFGKIAGMNAARPKADSPATTTDATSGASAHQQTSAFGSDLVAAPKTYTTGENQYIGRSSAGMGNEIVVRVTYADGKIQNIEVLQQNESGDFGLKAIQQLPDEMVKANSTDVDAVSGASVSSKALKEAVQDALKQAQK